MKIIDPVTITDAILTSSNIADSSGIDFMDGDPIDFMDGTPMGFADSFALDEWDATKLYAADDTVSVNETDYHHEFQALETSTSATVTITIASPGVVSWTAHGLADGTEVTFTTTGALPTGLAVGTIYFVANKTADTFEVAATAGGASINTSGTQSGTHTAVSTPNLNKDPTDAANSAYWLDLGYTNLWRPFDDKVGTVASNPDQITYTFDFTTRVDALAFFNVSGANVEVVSEVAGEEVYNDTFSLNSTANVFDWYTWFFEDLERRSVLLVDDLPPYLSQTITVTINDPGATVELGTLVPGRLRILGETLYGAGFGITDYSRKETDDFGNYLITQRAFANKGTFEVAINFNRVDKVQELLAERRATPTVYIGTDLYSSAIIYGFYKDFRTDVRHPSHSYCNIEIEGLT